MFKRSALEQIAAACANAIAHQGRHKPLVTLVVPRPWKDRPKGFPRGKLACVPDSDGKKAVYWFNADRVLDYLLKNKLVKMEIVREPPG